MINKKHVKYAKYAIFIANLAVGNIKINVLLVIIVINLLMGYVFVTQYNVDSIQFKIQEKDIFILKKN